MNICHILNGDALKEQFPSEISNEIYILRECLIDGPVSADSSEEFYQLRADFISTEYKVCSSEDYYKMSVQEFEKIEAIPSGSEVVLWFEEDLFCQINLWFALSLLTSSDNEYKISLVFPGQLNQYSFADLDQIELINLYRQRRVVLLSEVQQFVLLWKLFQEGSYEKLLLTISSLKDSYPFLKLAADSVADLKNGAVEEYIRSLIGELKTDEFEPLFREFTKRYSQFGFGDLQFKRILGKLLKNS